MSGEEEDLDLMALQRQLDDAFQTTRPRRGFEDQLWIRVQARRPFWRRMQDGVAGLIDGIREVPAVPAAAVAAVLIVVIGIGVVSLSGVKFGGSLSETTTAGPRSASGNYAQPAAPDSFGMLPTPALNATWSSPLDFSPSKLATAPARDQSAPANPIYLGPATLTWAGHINVTAAQAPVFRYQEPTGAFANQFAASLGAVPAASAGPGYLGTYSGQGFTLSVRPSSGAPPGEPIFVLTPSGSAQPASQDKPSNVALALLSTHNLAPGWANTVSVGTAGDQVRVNFLRTFAIPGQGVAYLVDGVGERYGLAVDLKGGQPVRAAGPLPLSLDSATYPIITADQAVRVALASSPAGPATIDPPPTVQLTTAQLVYAVVHRGDTLLPGTPGFYEPCFLFAGTFTYNGITYVKRVLVPAIDPSQLSP